jgi:hypothetical protein
MTTAIDTASLVNIIKKADACKSEYKRCHKVFMYGYKPNQNGTFPESYCEGDYDKCLAKISNKPKN